MEKTRTPKGWLRALAAALILSFSLSTTSCLTMLAAMLDDDPPPPHHVHEGRRHYDDYDRGVRHGHDEPYHNHHSSGSHYEDRPAQRGHKY